MMKKIFSVISIALLMASCASDDFEPMVSTGDEATVSFSINLNESVATRAISDGLTVDQLVWEVYDKDGERVDAISSSKAAFNDGLTETVNITLAKGQTYTFGFWAQKSGAYVTNDLTRVELNYEGVAGNDENRDAFFAYTEPITVNGDFEQEVILKRPFAQLNLGVSDLDAFKAAGISLNQVKVTISEAAGNFDIKTGKVSGAVPVEFNLADVLCNGTENPTLTLKNPLTINGEEVSSFPWISMNYLLVNDATTGAASDNVDVTFTITTSHDDVVLTSTNTPVQRNYRTNLIASLTNVGEFNLEIDPIYDAEGNGSLGDPNLKVYGVKASSGKFYEKLDDAIVAGESDIQLADGEYTISKNVTTSTLNITGASTAAKVSLATKAIGMGGASATFSNITIVSINENYVGFQHAADVTYNNCVIENQIFCYNDGDTKSVFNNCTFNQTSADLYNIWTYGSNVDFNNCVFNCAGKAALVYAESSKVWKDVNFKDCTFNASAAVAGKAAIEIDSSLHPYNVTIEGCTANGFGLGSVSGNSLYNLKKGEEGVNCNLTVAMADGVNVVAGVYEISNVNGLFWLADQVNVQGNSFAGKTVKLTENIDLANKLWAPIGQTGQPATFKGTFNGNNKTIFNLYVDETSDNATYHASGLFGWFEGDGPKVQNLTIDGAVVKGHHYVAAIIAYCEEGGVIEGCTVKNATVSCVFNTVTEDDGDKAGAVVGYLRGTVNDCHAEDCAIDAGRDAGQIVGAGLVANVTNCTATNVTVKANGTADGSNIREEIVGRPL